MTKQNILNKFENFRNQIVKQIFDLVNSLESKTIFLEEKEDCQLIDNIKIVTQIYKKLFIKDNSLFVEYEYGEGFEPCEYETICEELNLFSANEIYEIIMRIEE